VPLRCVKLFPSRAGRLAMYVEVPQALGGPVLHWELVRSARRLWCCVLHYGFLLWLLFQFVVLLPVASSANSPEANYPWQPQPSKFDLGYKQWTAQLARASSAVSSLLYQQLAVIFLLTPICAAGALGYEKEQDTLTALLGTQLLTRDIVVGKL